MADKEPDYCFDPGDWLETYAWTDREYVHQEGDALDVGQPMRVATLVKGPDWWVAQVPISFDEYGDPDETEIQWFQSEAEARAVISKIPEPA